MTDINTQVPKKIKPTPAGRPLASVPKKTQAVTPSQLKKEVQLPLSLPMNSISPISHEVPENVDPLLVTILSWPRKHESVTELEFGQWLTVQLGAFAKEDFTLTGGPQRHQLGSLSFTVLRPDKTRSTTLFSCHMDTVDSICMSGARKKLTYDRTFGLIQLDKDSLGMSLGADDGVGLWMMLRMIEAKVPGTYLFHRGEEVGGLSDKANATHEKMWLSQFEAAVAFDRPGDSEIITHQRCRTECASSKFRHALSAQLNLHEMDYQPSDRGMYTDEFE